MLGKPVELGWDREQTDRYLRSQDALPLTDYIPIPDVSVTALHASGFLLDAVVPYAAVSRGRIDGGVRDDDIDYTILALHLIETYGSAYRTFDVAYEWLHRLPLYQTYTAERAAYNNLVREVPLDVAGEFHNPFREWIGALIRADVFGYIRPGDPRAAAVMAYEDAVLSHRANGIYGAMWAAALISSAFVAESPDDSLALALAQIPPTSRLALEIETVRADHKAGRTWEECVRRIDGRHPGMSWVHTINNAGALTAALLWGNGDFTRTIGLAVLSGLDTDSIGATAGSWAGAFAGYDAIPLHWVEPLRGRTRSALFGFDDVDLDDLATRTHRLVRVART
jgi:ADP-ribosylglycohydrolase